MALVPLIKMKYLIEVPFCEACIVLKGSVKGKRRKGPWGKDSLPAQGKGFKSF